MCKRKSERKILEQAGYDIQQTADTLAQLYLNVAENYKGWKEKVLNDCSEE